VRRSNSGQKLEIRRAVFDLAALLLGAQPAVYSMLSSGYLEAIVTGEQLSRTDSKCF